MPKKRKIERFVFEFSAATYENGHLVVTFHPGEKVLLRPRTQQAAEALRTAIAAWLEKDTLAEKAT